MLYPKFEMLIYFMLLSILAACGSDYGDNDSSIDTTQSEEAPAPNTFNTRLNSTLLIAGDKCLGGETSEYNGQVITCTAGQYLVTVDNINTCEPSGTCTEVGVFPIIGELQITNDSDPNFSFYSILPRSPISIAQSNALNAVTVKTGFNGAAEVVFR